MPDHSATVPLPRQSRPWYQPFMALLIVALAPIGQMAIDIFVPSLPLMAAEFATDRQVVQLSVTLYLTAFALGQLVYGPLSDSWGRRNTLIVGLLVFLLGSVVCILAPSIGWFIAGRVVQGAGITAASVLMRAIATDCFQGPRLTQVLTYMVIGWGMGPIVAPVIGAFFQMSLGWRYSLAFLLVYGTVLLAMVALVMKESHAKPVPFSLSRLVQGIGTIYGNRRFVLIFLAMGCCYGALLAFNLVGPFIVQTVMGHGPAVFGAAALAMGAMYFGGVFSNRLMPASVSVRTRFRVASQAALWAALAQVLLAWVFDGQLWALVLPFAFVVLFGGVMYPNLMAQGMSAFPQMAGLASSLLGFSLMVIAAAIMGLSSLLQVQSLLPFALMTLMLMGAVFWLVRRVVN